MIKAACLITGIVLTFVLSSGCEKEKQNENKVSANFAAQSPSTRPLAITDTNTMVPKIYKGIIPTRIVIPKIGVNSEVEPVKVLSNGQMGVPKRFDRVGVLIPWTKVGEKGNAVIAGHFDHYTGPAVFYHLRKLKEGDKIFTSDSLGNSLQFVVKRVQSFKTNEAPLEEIFGHTSSPHLNLITCDGKYNKKTQEHARRLVVFTELVETSTKVVKSRGT